MNKVIYTIVRHDGGWAYRAEGTYSQTFPTHGDAHMAACRAALEQRRPGITTSISWEDTHGKWHAELSNGDDRPDVGVES